MELTPENTQVGDRFLCVPPYYSTDEGIWTLVDFNGRHILIMQQLGSKEQRQLGTHQSHLYPISKNASDDQIKALVLLIKNKK